MSQSAIGLSALAAAHFHFLRTGQEEEVYVDARHAVLEFSKSSPNLSCAAKKITNPFSFSDSEKYYTIDGKIPDGSLFDELSDIYKTKDGYVRLHTNFPQ